MQRPMVWVFVLVPYFLDCGGGSAAACPYCKTAAVGLAEAPAAEGADDRPTRYGITGGMDFASGYYFRGYRQVDPGLAWQSNLSVFAERQWSNGVIARPYLAGFHSANYGDEVKMADMTDLMAGVAGTWRGFTWDARFAYYNMNPTMRSPVSEFGVRLSADVLANGFGPEPTGPFSLRPMAGLFLELNDRDGSADTYIDLGVESAWKGTLLGQPVGVGVPLLWGLSPNSYYRDAFGLDATLGFFSVGVAGSVALPLSRRGGQWFLSGSVHYLRLVAPAVQQAADGDKDAVVGKIGIGFAY